MENQAQKGQTQTQGNVPNKSTGAKSKPNSMPMVLGAVIMLILIVMAAFLLLKNQPTQFTNTIKVNQSTTISAQLKNGEADSCTAAPGYDCNAVYYPGNDSLWLAFGQQTGQTWAHVSIAFVNLSNNQRVISSDANQSFSSMGIPAYNVSGTLPSGRIVNFTLAGEGIPAYGYVWVMYQIYNSSSHEYLITQIGTMGGPTPG